MAATTLSCSICTEIINKRTRRQVTCFNCGHDDGAPVQCAHCVEHYLLQSFEDPKCMNCRTAWNRDFVYRNMPQNFQKKFDSHRRNVLEQRERCNFPATMPLVQLHNETETATKELDAKRRALRDAKRAYQHAVRHLQDRRHRKQNAEQAILNGQPVVVAPPPTEAVVDASQPSRQEHFNRQCATPDCVGFISSRTGLCTTCNKATCLKCNKPDVDVDHHECEESDKATWEALAKETKACPGCNTRIFKISGCDQMWCPQCHTAFRWSTGQVERGAIHNPHYYEWLFDQNRGGARLTARRPAGAGGGGALRCDGPIPTVMELQDHLPRVGLSARLARKKTEIVNHHRKLVELHQYHLPTVREHSTDRILRATCLDLRVRLLTNQITADKYKCLLNQAEKKVERNREYLQIANTFLVLQGDALRGFMHAIQLRLLDTATPVNWETRVDDLTEQLNAHIGMANESIMALGKAFGSGLDKYKISPLRVVT